MKHIRTSLPLLVFLLFFISSTASRSQELAGKLTLDELQAIYNRENDTTYVINFWATWCGPCVMEMPALMKFYEAKKNTNVKLLLISLDQPKFEKQVAAFIKKNKIPAPVYLLDAGKNFDWLPQVDQNWQGSIPATLVINNKQKKRKFFETMMEPGQLEYYLKMMGL